MLLQEADQARGEGARPWHPHLTLDRGHESEVPLAAEEDPGAEHEAARSCDQVGEATISESHDVDHAGHPM